MIFTINLYYQMIFYTDKVNYIISNSMLPTKLNS